MSVTALVAVLLSQPTASMVVVAPPATAIEVGYRELTEGKPEAAIARIRADRRLRGDPVAMINIGTAYARLGQIELAKHNYRAALRSDERYDVELADGRIMDSHQAARLAIGHLEFASR